MSRKNHRHPSPLNNIVQKVVSQACRVRDTDTGRNEILVFRCEHHGTAHNPLLVMNRDCAECWAIVFLAQECLKSDITDGASLHKFDEAAHKIGEAARRGEWDYRPTRPTVVLHDAVGERGLVQLTDFA